MAYRTNGFELYFPPNLQFSDDELFEFCNQNSEILVERTQEGKIIIMSPTGGETGNINFSIYGELYNWNKTYQLGYLFDSSTGFKLPNGAVRSPDAAFITKERWEKLTDVQKEKFPPLCPDFIVELMSPSDLLEVLQPKMEEWIENGVKLAWLIQPKEEQVFIYQPNTEIELIEGFQQSIAGLDVLPKFALDLSLLKRR